MSPVIEWMAAEAERPDVNIPRLGDFHVFEKGRDPSTGCARSGQAPSTPLRTVVGPAEARPAHQFPGRRFPAQPGAEPQAAPEAMEDAGVEQERRVYRGRTVGMLRRYMRHAIETGRLPSLLGREFFRAKVTKYSVVTFEDRVIFVHDMEMCLEKLDEFSRQIIARHILQEHDQGATARLLHCTDRTVRNHVPVALDLLSDILLEVGLLERIENGKNSCQGGAKVGLSVSDCEDGENKGKYILDTHVDLGYSLFMNAPDTLQEAIVYFSDPDRAFDYAKRFRWPDGNVVCPRCNKAKHSFLKTRKLWFCYVCQKQFSLKLGTVFEDSALGLDKWMTGLWMLVNCRNGVSSCELARTLKITQKAAWFMLQRLRLVLQEKSFVKLGGPGSEVEVDETFIGGKARNMHKAKRERLSRDNYGMQGGHGKAVVMGMLERGGKIRAKVVPDRRKVALRAAIFDNVDAGTLLYTDEHPAYMAVDAEYIHKIVNHLERYVDGTVHTNGIENFWSLLKRQLAGTYISVEPFHLFRYVDEQAYRFNNRKDDFGRKIPDVVRFTEALSRIGGHRLTYSQLTGKEQSPRFDGAAGTGETLEPF